VDYLIMTVVCVGVDGADGADEVLISNFLFYFSGHYVFIVGIGVGVDVRCTMHST
jgi:hypothetical protein